MNIDQCKVMVLERSKSEATDFVCPYRVSDECPNQCQIRLRGEKMKDVDDFKCLGSSLCKHGW